MAGIYLHIPFCRRACTYCDFHFSTQLRRKPDMVLAIEKEISVRKDFFHAPVTIDSIYFGGGTPSVLNQDELRRLVEALHQSFNIAAQPEVTLEGNPDDLDASQLRLIRAVGVDRLSVGIQSFDEDDLKLLNRSHDAQQAANVVKIAQDAGFANISIDLIYGIPGSGIKKWEKNLEMALRLGVQHISAYALTVEPKTVLAHQVKKKTVTMPEDGEYEKEFFLLIDALSSAGFEHYEISNFALPGYRSKHNSSYWTGQPYLGLGPSAHSFDGECRSWNVRSNSFYIKHIDSSISTIDSIEQLRENDLFNEYLMTHLRLDRGIDLSYLRKRWNCDLPVESASVADRYLKAGHLENRGTHLALTPKGMMISDRIISDFFRV